MTTRTIIQSKLPSSLRAHKAIFIVGSHLIEKLFRSANVEAINVAVWCMRFQKFAARVHLLQCLVAASIGFRLISKS